MPLFYVNSLVKSPMNDNLRRMLGARENKLNFREIMDRGHVLIVNLGWCDAETRALMGSLLTVSLEQAAMPRVKIPEQFRRPFFCVIDEFQGFVDTDGSSHILSETRKAKVRFAFAHQGQCQARGVMSAKSRNKMSVEPRKKCPLSRRA